MFSFLQTPEGMHEIDCVAMELEEREKSAKAAAVEASDAAAEEAERRHNIYEVFRKYDLDG